MEKLMTIDAYAKKCGVSKTVIYNRIRAGLLSVIKKDNCSFLKANTKVVKAKSAGRPAAKVILTKPINNKRILKK